MKIRNGFVSNSSSSSFICSSCGDVYEIYDADSARYIVTCQNNHTTCYSCLKYAVENHMSAKIFLTELKRYVIDELDKTKNGNASIFEYDQVVGNKVLSSILNYSMNNKNPKVFDIVESEILGYNDLSSCFPSTLCPICNFYDYDPLEMISYIRKLYNIDMDVFLKERKLLHKGDYIDFLNFNPNRKE